MNSDFSAAMSVIPELFQRLNDCNLTPFGQHSIPKQVPGVYAFFRGEDAIHVGRTRDLRKRLSNHVTFSHNSASFAFKQARIALERFATYKPKGSRKELEQDPTLRSSVARLN